MEKLRGRDTLVAKKRKIVASTALAGVVFFGQAAFSADNKDYEYVTEGHDPYVYIPVPSEKFKKIDIPEVVIPEPYSKIIPTPSPAHIESKKLSKTELKIQKLKTDRDRIVKLAKQSKKFTKNQIQDLKIYWPIYEAAGKATGVDPEDLWVPHDFESGCSATNSRAFDNDSYYIGGMQLSPLIYNHYKDNPLIKKLAYLKAFPVRHKGDIENIIIAALYIGDNQDTVKNSVRSEQKGYIRFVGSSSAGLARYEEAKRRKKILAEQAKKEAKDKNEELVFSTSRKK